jgi:hypothetical protein
MTTFASLLALLLLASSLPAHAQSSVCDTIRAANIKTGSSGGHMKQTGYAFAGDTPKIYGLGDQTCHHLRDEVVGGVPTAVYREQYTAAIGSTDATIWISKTSGRLVREEEDGDVKGRGKGHISYVWPAKP